MLKDSSLRGYLLEESLAWLLRFSGYRLLVHEDQDPVELVTEGQTLRVRGRGALHQVDVLGEFAFTPAFSMPVRLFLEAKYYQTRCELEVVRNAHGVVHDVNENFMTGAGTRPRQRYKYSYHCSPRAGSHLTPRSTRSPTRSLSWTCPVLPSPGCLATSELPRRVCAQHSGICRSQQPSR